MALEVLKKPHELSKEELANIFKKATGFNFSEYLIEEFKINKDSDFIKVTCSNTGFSMLLYSDYSIKVDGYSNKIKNINLVEMTDVLLKNKIIKINGN